MAAATADGFVIALPYGATADWVQNVLAAGAAIVETDGGNYKVGHPQVVPAAVAQPWLPRRQRWQHRIYGIDEFLLLRGTAQE